MALWQGKKESVKDESAAQPAGPAAASGNDADELQALTMRLGDIGRQLGTTTEQVLAYLIQKESKSTTGGDGSAGLLAEKLDALDKKLDQLAAGGARADLGASHVPPAAGGGEPLAAVLKPLLEGLEQLDHRLKSAPAPATPAGVVEALGPALTQVRGGIVEQKEVVSAAIRNLAQRIDDGFAQIAEYVRPPEPSQEAPPVTSAEWERAVLGREIADNAALAFQRRQLLDGVIEGNAGACSLAGQLLVFQSAPAEKMPQLLKEIGEAYYRWQPKTRPGPNKMEDALVAWLRRVCEEAGIGNTVELVHPGERFDSTRHTAGDRGVEITEVFGWIVLRDNGKVYTKASVAVK